MSQDELSETREYLRRKYGFDYRSSHNYALSNYYGTRSFSDSRDSEEISFSVPILKGADENEKFYGAINYIIRNYLHDFPDDFLENDVLLINFPSCKAKRGELSWQRKMKPLRKSLEHLFHRSYIRFSGLHKTSV